MLTSDKMVGPTPEAREAQFEQWKARDAFYVALSAARRESEVDTPELASARKAYDATVHALETLLGPEAHCNQVDCDLWSSFSDCYKDETNIRPRFHSTRAQVQAWFKARSSDTAAA